MAESPTEKWFREATAPQPSTRQPISFQREELPKAEPASMVGPDGKVYSVQPSDVDKALQNGWQHASDEQLKHEAHLQALVKDEEAHRVRGGMERFSNALGGGIPELLYNKFVASPEEAKRYSEVQERFAEAHPWEAGAEKVGGFVAGALAPGVGEIGAAGDAARAAIEGGGEVAAHTLGQAGVDMAEQGMVKAAEASMGRKLVASAAKMGITGGIYAAPQAAVQAAVGNPEQAAETMLWGIGLSGLMGAGGRLLGEGVKAAVPAAASLAQKAVGAAAEKAESALTERLDGHYEKLEGLLEKPEMRAMGPVPMQAANVFQQEIFDKVPEIMQPLHADKLGFATELEKAMTSGGAEPSFTKLREVQAKVAELAKGHAADSVQGKMASLADAAIQQQLDTSAQQMFASGALKADFPDFVSVAGKLAKGAVLGSVNPVLGAASVAKDVGKDFALQKFLQANTGLLSKGAGFLRKVAADPTTAPLIGGFMAKEGMAGLSAHIDSLPGLLAGSQVAAKASSEALPAMLGSTSGLSKAQQYDKLTQTITAATTDAGTTAQRVGALATTFSGTSTELAALVAQKKLAALSYLQQAIPKDPNPPRPFQRGEWKPTKAQQAEFLNRVEVVHNPMVVWDHYQKGALTKADKETLQAVYPSTYNAMVQKIVETAHDPRAPALPHAKRMQLSMFTGQPLDASLKNMSAIQDALSQPTQGDQSQGQAAGPKPSSRPKLHSPKLGTDTQRRTYGGSAT